MKDEIPSASPVQREVKPRAWAHSYSDSGILIRPRSSAQDAADDVAVVGGTAQVVALYDQAAIDAAVAAEKARLIAIARRMICPCCHSEEACEAAAAICEALQAA
jgi:hypothetical protein